jgi:hypothetical protein
LTSTLHASQAKARTWSNPGAITLVAACPVDGAADDEVVAGRRHDTVANAI